MKINKETRQHSKELLRASFIDGKLDNGRIAALVMALIKKKPRNYIKILESYKRLLRLEVEKRTATIETATATGPRSERANCGKPETQIRQRPDCAICREQRAARRNAHSRRQRRLGQQCAQSPAPSPTTTLTQLPYEQYPGRHRNADRRSQDHDEQKQRRHCPRNRRRRRAHRRPQRRHVERDDRILERRVRARSQSRRNRSGRDFARRHDPGHGRRRSQDNRQTPCRCRLAKRCSAAS